jgi:hypothetical protein
MGALIPVPMSPTLHVCLECGRPWMAPFLQKEADPILNDSGDLPPRARKGDGGSCSTCGRPF